MGFEFKSIIGYYVTPEMANKVSRMTKGAFERTLDPKRVAFLRNELVENRFRTTVWTIARCNGAHYRVNGQHTSYMLATLETALFPQKLKIMIETYDCDTMADVQQLFSTFDSSKSNRTQRDIILSMASVTEELRGIPVEALRNIALGIIYIENGGVTREVPAGERARKLLQYTSFCNWYRDVLGSPSTKHLRRGQAMAAIIATWQACPTTAKTFWDAVLNDTIDNNRHPCHLLLRYFREHPTGLTTKKVDGKSAVVHVPFYATAVAAWNMFIKGRSAKNIVPIRDAGTVFPLPDFPATPIL